MNTDHDEQGAKKIQAFVGDEVLTVSIGRKNRPHLLKASSLFELSRINFNLSDKCQKLIIDETKVIKHSRLRSVFYAEFFTINGRFRQSDSCPLAVDSYFRFSGNYKLLSQEVGRQLLAHTDYLLNKQVIASIRFEEDLTRNTIINYNTLPGSLPSNITIGSKHDVPSAMTILSINETSNQLNMLYVYDNILYTMVKVVYEQQINPLTIPTFWFSINKLIGCPPQLCLDAHFDAADYNSDKNQFSYHSGPWTWTSTSLPTTEYMKPTKSGLTDTSNAKFFASGQAYYLNDRYLIYELMNGIRRTWSLKVFNNTDIRDVDAAFSIPLDGDTTNVYLIIGRQLFTYNLTPPLRIQLINTETTIGRWTNIFHHIDTAMFYNNTIYLTSNSFFVRSPRYGQPSDVKLIQNDWFLCDDGQYQRMAKTWNVTNFVEFEAFKMRFTPEVARLPPTTSSTSLTSLPTTTQPKKNTIFIVIILLIAFLVIAILVIVIVVWRRSDHDDNSEATSTQAQTASFDMNPISQQTGTENSVFANTNRDSQDLPTQSTSNTMS